MWLGLASEWAFLGEGGANIVFGYTGGEPELLGKGLRVKKKVRVKEDHMVRALEDLVWAPYPRMVGTDTLTREAAFFEDVMAPLLGQDYIAPVVVAKVGSDFVAEVLLANSSRLRHFEKTFAQLELDQHTDLDVMLVTDLTKLPPDLHVAVQPSERTSIVCVELKPKCGFVLKCESIHPCHYIKQQSTRFHLQQGIKLAEGSVPHISAYSPLNLFSGNEQKISDALDTLAESPQNNIKVFKEGRMVYGFTSDTTGMGVLGDALQESGTKPFAIAPSGVHAGQLLLRLLTSVLQQETAAIAKLLKVQQLETVDIEGVYEVYQRCLELKPEERSVSVRQPTERSSFGLVPLSEERVLSGKVTPYTAEPKESIAVFKRISSMRKVNKNPLARKLSCGCCESPHFHTMSTQCSLGIPYDEEALRRRNEFHDTLRAMPFAEMLELVRNYIVAKTAQDCSMMFTLKQVEAGCSTSSRSDGTGFIADADTGLSFFYQMRFVDLDVKSIAKIPRHYQADLERVHAWHRLSHLGRKPHECSPSPIQPTPQPS